MPVAAAAAIELPRVTWRQVRRFQMSRTAFGLMPNMREIRTLLPEWTCAEGAASSGPVESGRRVRRLYISAAVSAVITALFRTSAGLLHISFGLFRAVPLTAPIGPMSRCFASAVEYKEVRSLKR